MGRGYKTSLFSAAKKSINSSGSLSISVPITLGALIKFKSTYLSPSVTFIPMPKKEGGDLYQNGLTFTNAMGYFKINIGLMFK
ncbi:MAG: hypothetical protein IT239_03595 [Bacteroidia bacterium]|nr:hypothetical protein [Bacteroidia bacterium]